jgi:soluble lytic murein transglycosylase-like protein
MKKIELIAYGLVIAVAVTALACPNAFSRKCEAVSTDESQFAVEVISEPYDDVKDDVTSAIPLYDVPLSMELQLHIIHTCEAKRIDPAIVVAMAFRESTYNAKAIGDNGESFGLLQIQPYWHSERMERLGCTDLLDPFQNVTVGVDYLAELLDRYDGDMAKALVAYNRGHYAGTVTEYAKTILAMAEEL